MNVQPLIVPPFPGTIVINEREIGWHPDCMDRFREKIISLFDVIGARESVSHGKKRAQRRTQVSKTKART